MIYEKTLSVPQFYRRSVRRKFSTTDADQTDCLYVPHSLHFRPKDGALVCGEGEARVAPANTLTRLFLSGGELYGSDGTFLYRGETLEKTEQCDSLNAVITLRDENGVYKTYGVTDSHIYRLDGTLSEVSGGIGGTCAAFHYERLFTANGVRVSYSRALSVEDWSQAEQGAGYLDLPTEDGNIVAMISFKEKLYLFREHGIAQLRVLGDNLNFKFVSMPYACGKLYGGTVVNCGTKVLFFTESGLYSFNGARCERLAGSVFHLYTADKHSTAARMGDRYYAAVNCDGTPRLFSYDFEEKTGYLARSKAELTAGDGETLYLISDGYLCRATACGFPSGEAAQCVLDTDGSAFGLSADKFLDSVTVEGEGVFRVTAQGEGTAQSVCGRAGVRLSFPVPLRGASFRLKITAYEERTLLRGVVLSVREETYGN